MVAAIEGRDESRATGSIEIWPENWETVTAFAEIRTQWRVVPLARGGLVHLGLDYAGAQAGLALAGIVPTQAMWRGIRTMEAETCAVLNQLAEG